MGVPPVSPASVEASWCGGGGAGAMGGASGANALGPPLLFRLAASAVAIRAANSVGVGAAGDGGRLGSDWSGVLCVVEKP